MAETKKMKIGLSNSDKNQMKNEIEGRLNESFDLKSKEIDAKLKNQDNTIKGLGKLHPSGTATESEIMAFTSDKGIYIGTDTGNWYYWSANDNIYVSGGVYQAVEAPDNSISYEKLDSNLKTIIANNKWEDIKHDVKGGFVSSSDGYVNEDSQMTDWLITNYIPCYPGQKFKLTATLWNNIACGVAFYNDVFAFIESQCVPTIADYVKYNEIVITAPANARYVIFGTNNDSHTDHIFEIKKMVDEINTKSNEINHIFEIPILKSGWYLNDGTFQNPNDTNWGYTDYIPVSSGDKIYYSGFMWRGALHPIACLYDSKKNFVDRVYGGYRDFNREFDGVKITIPNGVKYITLNWLLDANTDTRINKVNKAILVTQEQLEEFPTKRGKTAVWFGTSIPNGYPNNCKTPYPQMVAEKLGMTIYNEAIGSSCARAGNHNAITETDMLGWTGLSYQAVAYSLSMSLTEKQGFIDNFSSWKTKLTGCPESLSAEEIEFIKQCSFENKVLRYLNGGSVGEVDYYIFDHGHNDNLANLGITENMKEIPSDIIDRTYFIGAMSYLFKIILARNPKARILIIGHYENSIASKKQVSEAQEILADLWNFPIDKTWQKAGWSQNTVLYDGKETTIQQIWLPDNLHPGSDATGKANDLLANIHATFIKNNF